ncbi:MAG: 16S rRNA (cytosine(1402)-N(4))-methyltransferase RsmH [Patescibacteria group bacterium]
MAIHEPVLLREVLFFLNPQPDQNFVDCTFGGGGHALAIAEKIGPIGRLIGIDWDSQAIQTSSQGNLILINDNYKNLKKIIKDIEHGSGPITIRGILFDLGLSSDQLGSGDRGFSFENEGRLDLRFDNASETENAGDILENYSEQDLSEIFKSYGEEPLARLAARIIVADRSVGREVATGEYLSGLMERLYKKHFRQSSRKHPATRVFQALRIAVNDEFGNISRVLPEAVELLEKGGRLAVISFHSGEDRIVKNFFREKSRDDNPQLKIITKKPVIAKEDELISNPRSRSAKLRVAEKI